MDSLRRMIHSKNHKPGFTLIEVLMAMTITALVLTPIFLIYETVMQRVTVSSQVYDLIVSAKNLLYEARRKQEPQAQSFTLEKKENDVTLIYSLAQAVDQKSSLASLTGLHKEMVTLSWTEQGKKKQEQLVTFVYKQPEQKK